MTLSTQMPSPAAGPGTSAAGFFYRLACLCEVFILLAISFAAGLWALQAAQPGMAEALGFANGSEPDLWAGSVVFLKQFAAQYGSLVLLVWLFARLQGGRPRRSFGLTLGSRSAGGWGLGKLLGAGLLAGLIVGLPIHFLFVARDLWSLGQGTPLWLLADRVPWDLGFWVFFAVGSFVLVPIVEEFAWRGYALGRIAEGFGPGAAILVTTLFFSGLHVQYFIDPDPSKMIAVVGLILGALVFGSLTVHSGSLLPAIVAHALINTPMAMDVHLVFLALGLFSLFVFVRPIARLAVSTFSMIATRQSLVALLMLIGLAAAGYGLWRAGGIIAAAPLPVGLAVLSIFLRRTERPS